MKKEIKVTIPELEKQLKQAKAKLINKAHNDATDLANARQVVQKIEAFKIKGSVKKRVQRLQQQINLLDSEIIKLGEKQERRKYRQYYNDLRHDNTGGVPNRLLRMAKAMRIDSDYLQQLIEEYGAMYLSNISGDELYDTIKNDSNPIYKGTAGHYYYDIDEIRDFDFDTYNDLDFPYI